jgi:prepilin-type N-terminal cleavage/methylation domain-containing protein
MPPPCPDPTLPQMSMNRLSPRRCRRFPRDPRFQFRSERRAFTLLELLVSVTILALLVILLFSIVEGATRLWRSSENRVDSYREARAALNVIASDLRSALITTDTNFFRINAVTYPGSGAPPNRSGSLFFITALPPDAQAPNRGGSRSGNDKKSEVPKSELCAVGYFVAYEKTSPDASAERSFNLYRFFRNSNDTFEEGIKEGQPFEEVAINEPTDVLARNITSFKIDAYTYAQDAETGEITVKPFAQSSDTPTPDFLDITLTAINHETARALDSREEWEQTNAPPILNSQQEFTTRIELKRAP